jgi:hypothetical protein
VADRGVEMYAVGGDFAKSVAAVMGACCGALRSSGEGNSGS